MGTNSDKILQEPAMLADDNVTDLRGGDDAAYQEFSKLYEAKILGSTAMNSSFEAENRLKGKLLLSTLISAVTVSPVSALNMLSPFFLNTLFIFSLSNGFALLKSST